MEQMDKIIPATTLFLNIGGVSLNSGENITGPI